ncbi:hypothetical protein FH972_024076 [Carpinus fangiana]|uniref:PD-(D/E)XK nuclease-like domain-containing protein n=1 Tax=Carpinus fangiana TaxID=176857 RepID=A0A5N6KWZ0_9ROSI|nr:hypothetical protein FH972_024076 [Carpinus fangiana]
MNYKDVTAWLEAKGNTADPASRKRPRTPEAAGQPPFTTTSHKRPRQCRQAYTPSVIELSDTNQTAMSRMPQQGRGRLPVVPVRGRSTYTPSESHHRHTLDDDTTVVGSEGEGDTNNMDLTSRPVLKRVRSDEISLPPPSETDSTSTRSRRSSPSKKALGNIGLSHRHEIINVEPHEWTTQSPHTPSNVFEILEKIRLLRHDVGIVAWKERDNYAGDPLLQAKLATIAEPAEDSQPSIHDGSPEQTSTNRASFGRSPSLEFMDRIINETSRHTSYSGNEAGFNCFVHAPMLAEALYLSTSGRQLRYAFPNVQSVDGEKSYNHTYFEQTRTTPIFTHIETKAGYGGPQACTQLCVSAIAAHNRLEQLARQKQAHMQSRGLQASATAIELPAIPLLIANGAEWSLLIASRRTPQHTDFFHCGANGGTGDRSGILRLNSILQAIFHWGCTTFAGWFEKYAEPVHDT